MPVKKKPSSKGWLVFILLLLAGGAGAAYRYWPRPQPISTDSVRRPLFAVLVFENLNKLPELDFLANALTHDTISKIGQLCSGGFDVIGHESIATYRNTRKSLHQIGRELGVDYIVEGGVLKDGENVQLTAQLTRVSDQIKLWSFEDSRSMGDVSDIQNEIIQKIAASLRVTIQPSDLEAMNRSTTENSTAREAYLHAREIGRASCRERV